MSRLRKGALSLALLLLVSACSSGEDEASPTTVEPTTSTTTTTVAPTTTTSPPTTTATSITTTVPPKDYPNGTLIAFSSDRAGTGALFVVDTADGEVRQIGYGLETMISPAWSPDGRSLAYVSLSGRSKLATLDAAGAWEGEVEPVELTDGALEVDEPAWSPDGVTIAFTVTTENGDNEIWTIPAQGGEPQLLLGNAEGPSFSPDGERLAFVELGERESAIAVLDLGSGDITRLTDPADRGITPQWSTDGSQIAYTSGTGDFDVWIVDVASSESHRLVGETDREWWPCWTGAGEVAYARFNPETLHDIWLVDLVGGTMTPLIDDPSDDWFPACQPSR